jgi:hypothetical protein
VFVSYVSWTLPVARVRCVVSVTGQWAIDDQEPNLILDLLLRMFHFVSNSVPPLFAGLLVPARHLNESSMPNVDSLYKNCPSTRSASLANVVCKHADMRTALFWPITQHAVVIPYRRFETTYRPHLQGSRIHLKLTSLFNPLKSKRTLLYLKHQSVPRCKHFSSRLKTNRFMM